MLSVWAEAAAGQLTDALRAVADYPLNDDEIEVFNETGYFEAAARYVPNLLDVFRQLASWDGPTADDPAVLGTITVPVLVLRGEAGKPFWVRGAEYVADQVPNGRLRVIPAAGHAGPITHPEAAAAALAAFFTVAVEDS